MNRPTPEEINTQLNETTDKQTKHKTMQTTEQEFYLLSELITMENREVAMRAETLIWDHRGRVRNDVLERMVKAIMSAPTAIEFHTTFPELCNTIAKELGMHASVLRSEDVYKCKMQGPDLHGFRL